MGRPKKSLADRRIKRKELYFTESDYEALSAYAAQSRKTLNTLIYKRIAPLLEEAKAHVSAQ